MGAGPTCSFQFPLPDNRALLSTVGNEKHSMNDKKPTITFVTGNKKKLAEVTDIISPYYHVENASIDLLEVQGSVEDIAAFKAREAYSQLKVPLIVEDTCLAFDAMGGLPGPYVKWFLDPLGPSGLIRMLSGFPDKKATAICTFAYFDGNEPPLIFQGQVRGTIADAPRMHPSTTEAFGWDPIFQPDGYTQTYAEMPKPLKNSLSHRKLAIDKLVSFLKSQ